MALVGYPTNPSTVRSFAAPRFSTLHLPYSPIGSPTWSSHPLSNVGTITNAIGPSGFSAHYPTVSQTPHAQLNEVDEKEEEVGVMDNEDIMEEDYWQDDDDHDGFDIEEIEEDPPPAPRSSSAYRALRLPDTIEEVDDLIDPDIFFDFESPLDESTALIPISVAPDPPETANPRSKPAKSSLGKVIEGTCNLLTFTLRLIGSLASSTLSSAAEAIHSIGAYVDDHGPEFSDKLASSIHNIGAATSQIIANTATAGCALAEASAKVGIAVIGGTARFAGSHGPEMSRNTAEWIANGFWGSETVEIEEGRWGYLKRKLKMGGTPPGTYLTDDGQKVVITPRGSRRRSFKTSNGNRITLSPIAADNSPRRVDLSSLARTSVPQIASRDTDLSGISDRRRGWFARRSRSRESADDDGNPRRGSKKRNGSKDERGRTNSRRQDSNRDTSTSSSPAEKGVT